MVKSRLFRFAEKFMRDELADLIRITSSNGSSSGVVDCDVGSEVVGGTTGVVTLELFVGRTADMLGVVGGTTTSSLS